MLSSVFVFSSRSSSDHIKRYIFADDSKLNSPFPHSGVADGVGGWRDYGVDPSQFSATLMRTCERLVKEGRFSPNNPVGILTSGYYELLQNKIPLLGECERERYTHWGRYMPIQVLQKTSGGME